MSGKDDYISRRDAIEEISKHGTIWMSYTDDMSACEIAMEAISNAKDTMIRIIKGLPAAQPQIIRCKDCKYMIDIGDDLMCDNAKGWVVATTSDFGCVLAERRTE